MINCPVPKKPKTEASGFNVVRMLLTNIIESIIIKSFNNLFLLLFHKRHRENIAIMLVIRDNIIKSHRTPNLNNNNISPNKIIAVVKSSNFCFFMVITERVKQIIQASGKAIKAIGATSSALIPMGGMSINAGKSKKRTNMEIT